MIIHLTLTPIFDWCVVGHKSKNGHQKAKCLKEFELHAQNLLTSLDSKSTLIGKENANCHLYHAGTICFFEKTGIYGIFLEILNIYAWEITIFH